MRFKVFVSLLVITLVLDIALLSISFLGSAGRIFELPVALAAEPPVAPSHPQPTATTRRAAAMPTTTPTAPTAPPTATHTPVPTPTALPTATAAITATATATVAPAQLLAAKSVAFTPGDKAVRANIRLALDHYYGALTHIVLPPGGVFSFNSTLGVRPQRLPWKNVKLKATAAPAPPAATDVASAPTPAAVAQSIQGGGLCDLASRFVMAARPLLPAGAFRFVNHVKSNGIHLSGVPTRDTVSIWAIGGGKGEHDLLISNPTNGWLEFTVDRDGEKITVTARLWDNSPPGW